jgi:hypothetical protein
MAFWLTNAPDDYDYGYVKTVQELGTVTGERGKWRVIEDSDTEGRFEGYQKPRYQSGMYAVYPANGPDAKRMGVTISTGAGRSGVGGGYERYTTDDDDDAGNYGYTKLNLSTGDERAYWFKTRAARDAAYTRGKAQPSQYGYGKPDRKILRRQALAVSRRGSDLDGVSGTGAGRSGVGGVSKQKTTITLTTRYSDRTTTIPANVTADRIAWVSRTSLRNAERRLRMIGGDYLRAHTADGTQVDIHPVSDRNLFFGVSGVSGLDGVSKQTRKGTRVRFVGSRVGYTHAPRPNEEGTVTTMPGYGARTYLPGPGGGLLYVTWDESGTIGISPNDVE